MDRKLATSEAFLDKGAYDPMRHACADLFWFHVEPSFHPFLAEDISALKALEPQPATTRETTIPLSAAERAAQGEEAKADDAVAARTRSFPITQRLIAAFLDEGKGTGSANRALRQNPAPERTWMPGELPEMREFSRILERRIVAELEGVGLLSPGDDDEVAETMRLDQWHLRNLITGNTATHSHIQKRAREELQTQSARRSQKRSYDQTEVTYLKKMMETGGKRGKSKYSKILTAMHPNRDLSVGAPLPRAGNPAPASAPSGGSKKKKRKSGGGSHKSKAAVVDPVHSSGGGGGGDLAPHIAEIIERNGGTASLDTIVEGYAATGPPVGMDGDELRSKIQKIIAFSRKPYRFPRHPDRKTYSVEKVA